MPPSPTEHEAPHILVVDDHQEIRELLSDYLKKQGYRVTVARDSETGRRALEKATMDLVVLDIMMPGEDGLDFCRHLRATTAVPVIFLTAVTEDTDRVIGLEVGADDYVTKPFNPRELLARIKAVLRRTNSLPPNRATGETGRIAFAGWTLDVDQRELVDPNGVTVPLSTGEFNLLMAFIDHPRVVLSRDQLLDRTQGREAMAYDRSIDNQVSRLRHKIEANPARPALIKTVWGTGYQFVADPERL